ncbi:unnamed protein product [Prunus armeniaca]|uniref:Uncharacterized protein n=1 Tax=Prunus armeniaca TaxID=36596 RepID=A0A6J5USB8_PRUAR|nr:unnamed protein product [Prunus armeniaca]
MSGSIFAKLLDKHCLEGHNFPTWYRNLKIFMTIEKIVHILEQALDIEPLLKILLRKYVLRMTSTWTMTVRPSATLWLT